MAVSTGTVAGHLELLTALRDFLITQSWTVLKEEIIDDDRFIYFQGPQITVGTTSVNVHVNIRAYQDTALDIYNWELRGASAFNTNEPFDNQLSISPKDDDNVSGLPLFTANIDYNFIANDRRFIVIVKVSTTFQSCYCGLILSYATPTEFPYALYIGGSSGDTQHRFSLDDYDIGSCFDPAEFCAYFRHIDGNWLEVRNYRDSRGAKNIVTGDCYIWPWRVDLLEDFISNVDGTYTLLPAVMVSIVNGGNVYGELEGVFYVSGFANASENTITIDSVTYLVVQIANRNNPEDFAAIRLV